LEQRKPEVIYEEMHGNGLKVWREGTQGGNAGEDPHGELRGTRKMNWYDK